MPRLAASRRIVPSAPDVGSVCGAAADWRRSATRTVGVEEALLVDAGQARLPGGRGRGGRAQDSDTDRGGEGLSVGLSSKREQAEIGSPPCSSLDASYERQLRRLRAEVVSAAARHGVEVAALATSPHCWSARHRRTIAATG